MKVLRLVGWELRQHLRDPLTLVFMVGIPLVLYPVLGFFAQRVQALNEERTEQQEVSVAVDGTLPLPPSVVSTVSADPDRAVTEGTADAGVRVTDAGATVWVDSRNPRSGAAKTRVLAALDEVRVPRLDIVNEVDEAQRTAEKLSRTLPAILVVTLLLGGLYTALDIVTGEKERGTLETLLSTASDRRTLFAAKFLVVLLFTCLTAVLSLAAGWVSLRLFSGFHLPLGTLVACFTLFLPIAVFLSVALTVAAAWVPDFKTGQVLSVPIMLVPGIAASAAMFPGVELTWAWALVPLSNLAIALRQVVLGDVKPGPLVLTIVASLVYTGVALAVGSRLLGREDVLLGTRGPTQRRLHGDYRADALLAYVVGLLLLWFVGQSAQAWDLVWGLVITQVGLIAPLAIGVVLWVGLPPHETFSAQAPRLRDLALAVLAGLCLPGVGLTVQMLQDPFLHAPKGLFDAMSPDGVPLPVVLLSFALLPGICEELLFRGAILGLLRRRGGGIVPVLVTAFAFGAFHLSVFRFFPTAVLGVLLGLLVIRSRSLACSMVAHVINNAVILTVATLLPDLEPGWWAPVVGAGALAAVWAVGRSR
jgi:sodium transport system permease protein